MKPVRATATLALIAFSFISGVAHAYPDDEMKVYAAMPGYGVEIKINGPKAFQKEIGGLRCRELKTLISYDGSGYLVGYECKLRRNRDDAAIFDALQVPAKRDSSTSGSEIVDVKAVGNLTCKRKQSLENGTIEHSCKLKTSWFF